MIIVDSEHFQMNGCLDFIVIVKIGSVNAHYLPHRLKAEMIARIKKVAAEFRRVTEKTLNTTIKRTLNENVMVSAQLAKMSDKTVELIEENDRQSANTIKLEQKINLLESNEKLLTKRFQKGLKVLCLDTLVLVSYV